MISLSELQLVFVLCSCFVPLLPNLGLACATAESGFGPNVASLEELDHTDVNIQTSEYLEVEHVFVGTPDLMLNSSNCEQKLPFSAFQALLSCLALRSHQAVYIYQI